MLLFLVTLKVAVGSERPALSSSSLESFSFVIGTKGFSLCAVCWCLEVLMSICVFTPRLSMSSDFPHYSFRMPNIGFQNLPLNIYIVVFGTAIFVFILSLLFCCYLIR